jgi:cell division protein FtsB
MQLLRSAPVLAHLVLFCCIAAQPSVAQDAAPKKTAKKVWTNDDLQHLSSPDVTRTLVPSSDTGVGDLPRNHYLRAKDPKWYAKQLGPLREEIARIDQQLRDISEARKGGRGTTGAVALDQEPEGVSSDAQIELLQKRRAELVLKIDDLESEARRNEVPPGALRTEVAPDKPGTGSKAPNGSAADEDPDVVEAENSIQDEKEHLERAKKELDLLQRGLDLDQRQVYSNPNYLSSRSGDSKLSSIESQISGKRQEIQQAEQEISQLEEHLEDLELNRPADSGSGKKKVEGTAAGGPGAKDAAKEEKGETYWRKRFADMRYKIGIVETERDILQRELNVLLLEYDPNPEKAMRENVTRKAINDHRKAIEDKQKEIEALHQGLSDLEDELRRAGGYPGWSRE